MAKRKSITVKAGHEGKRWSLAISGTDREARKKIIQAIMFLSKAENGSFQILNGASPFGDDDHQGEPKQAQGALL